MDNFLFYTVEDFAEDYHFIRWALNEESNPTFDHLYEKYPHKRQEMDEAIELVRFFEGTYDQLGDDEVYDLWKRIKSRKKQGNRPFLRKLLRYAAVFIGVAVAGGLLYSQWESFRQQRAFFAEKQQVEDSSRFQLTLSDGRQVDLESDTARIRYSQSGKSVQVDSRQIQNNQGEGPAMNKLSIPYGKRSHITLADGSEIWVNSGSQLVYPSSFDGAKRKVYLKGEAFFQVHEDKSKPFIVKTSDLDIQVLGTRFNVNSYQENDQIETVLVDGKVKIEQRGIQVFDRDVVLKPSERASFSKENKSMKREKVDPRYYTSWKDGYLYLQNEDLGDIVQKLRRIYNRNIVLDDRLKSLTFSGKLDLRESLKKELTIISAAYPIRYSIEEDKITIEP